MFSCILHGSFRKHLKEIQNIYQIFEEAGIKVLAPTNYKIEGEVNGFVFFENEANSDPRLIELLYLQNLKKLGKNGFSYFVNPTGDIGVSASYEFGIAHTTNVPCFFLSKPKNHPGYVAPYQILGPEKLVSHIKSNNSLPESQIPIEETKIHALWSEMMVPGSVVAVGAIIEHVDSKDTLVVKTHKWDNKYSIIGGKVRQKERLSEALLREVKEETQLDGQVDAHLCTFDQIKNSGYYQPWVNHIYVDNIVKVNSKNVSLNEEAEEYLWIPVKEALKELDIEPNARHTLEIYARGLS